MNDQCVNEMHESYFNKSIEIVTDIAKILISHSEPDLKIVCCRQFMWPIHRIKLENVPVNFDSDMKIYDWAIYSGNRKIVDMINGEIGYEVDFSKESK